MKRIFLIILTILLCVSFTACAKMAGPPKEVKTEYDENGNIIKEANKDFVGGYYFYEYNDAGNISFRYDYIPIDEEPYAVTEYFYENGKLHHTEKNDTDGAYWYTSYYESGAVAFEECYANGKHDSATYYDEQGRTTRTTEYRDGVIYRDYYFDIKLSTEDRRFIARRDDYDENGKLKFSEKYTLEENGNYRTEIYMPTSDGTDTYLYMVIVQESDDWTSDRIEEIKYDQDGNIIYRK